MSAYQKPSKEELSRLAKITDEMGDADYTRKKNRTKRIRTAGEWIVILAVIGVLINLFFVLKEYSPYGEEAVAPTTDTGFIALSYFGVDRMGDTSTLIGKELLRQHLTALHDQGYVTISQKDILAFYNEGRPLPQKALYLMFEDGRRDTAVFSEEIMEDLNYKATMMTYPEKFDNHDPKFLMPKELREMVDSTFWEMGTNGYRLEYINVFDRYNRYIGEIDPLRYAMIHDFLGRRYNHFLMDYIRDEHGVPKESYEHMKARVSYDYTRVRDIYEAELGYTPATYVLMHANTGSFGNNPDVSAVNEKWIRSLFAMNFNREGTCFNQTGSSLYDLTRMQPQAYWPVNHLLMRIKYDINQPVDFIEGDAARQAAWTLVEGASEIKEERYILTTMPEGKGLARLNDSSDYRDVRVSCRLKGNAFGTQEIYLRADSERKNYVRVALVNDQLLVAEAVGGQEKEIYKEKLPVILGETIPSVEEDSRAAEVRENEAFARYADSPAMAQEYASRAREASEQPAASVADGAEAYEGTQSFHRRSDHLLDISLRDSAIAVSIDGHEALYVGTVQGMSRGSVWLGAAWKSEAWSQRNLADDVYDAVFDQLKITTNSGKESIDDERVLYTVEYTGWKKRVEEAREVWEAILHWFLTYL